MLTLMTMNASVVDDFTEIALMSDGQNTMTTKNLHVFFVVQEASIYNLKKMFYCF